MATFIIKCGDNMVTIEAKTLTAAKGKATKIYNEADQAGYEAAKAEAAAAGKKLFEYKSPSLAVLDENGEKLSSFGAGKRCYSAWRWNDVKEVKSVEPVKKEEVPVVEEKTEEFTVVFLDMYGFTRKAEVLTAKTLTDAKVAASKMQKAYKWSNAIMLCDDTDNLVSQKRLNLKGRMVWLDYVEPALKKCNEVAMAEEQFSNSLRDTSYRGNSTIKTTEISGKVRTELVSVNGAVRLAMADAYAPVTFYPKDCATIGKPTFEAGNDSYPVSVGALNALNKHFSGEGSEEFARLGFVYTKTGAVVVTERNAESLGEEFFFLMMAGNQ